MSVDPLGYVDGPSVVAFALNAPNVHGDSLGLATGEWWDPGTWLESDEEKPKKISIQAARRLIEIDTVFIVVDEAWTYEDAQAQVDFATDFFLEEAGILISYESIQLVPSSSRHSGSAKIDTKSVMSRNEASLWIDKSQTNGVFGGSIPILLIDRFSDLRNLGGIGIGPGGYPFLGGAVVARNWYDPMPNAEQGSFVSTPLRTVAHELGHVVGGLCDPLIFDLWCRPQPSRDSLMQYPPGTSLSVNEVRVLRRGARQIETRQKGAESNR